LKTWIEYIIIAVILIIISLVIVKLSKRDFNENSKSGYTAHFVYNLKADLANKDGIQKLGAKGIVEIDNQLKIIFDKNAKQLKKYIEEIL